MRKLAVEKGEAGNVPVVISMCSIKDEMCTHYAVRVFRFRSSNVLDLQQEILDPQKTVDSPALYYLLKNSGQCFLFGWLVDVS